LVKIKDKNKIPMLGPKEEPKSLKLVGKNILIKNKFSLLYEERNSEKFIINSSFLLNRLTSKG
jgi:hypothetical protein